MRNGAWFAWSLCLWLAACSDNGKAPEPDAIASPDAAVRDARADGAGSPGEDAGVAFTAALSLMAPSSVAPGMLFTVVVRSAEPIDGALSLCADGAPAATLRLYRGRGSTSLRLLTLGETEIRVCGDDLTDPRRVVVEDRPVRVLSGTLAAADMRWEASGDVRVIGDLTVPAGATLRIEAGTRVRFDSRAAIVVLGALEVAGSRERPVIFTAEPLGEATPPAWGGLIFRPGSQGALQGAWFNLGGGDVTREFGHSRSQAVIAAEGAQVSLRDSGLVDNVGKAFGMLDTVFDVDDVLVSRCDTGGQLNRTALTMRGSHVLEIPDADGRFEDDDNDGIYLAQVFLDARGEPVESLIVDTVFAVGEDDAIDHNGALVRIERAWIEGFRHEGLAASNKNRAVIVDSVVRGCEHGIEAGYGAPEVIVERCFVTDNEHGLHVGDSYDWVTDARMRVTNTVSVGNRQSNARNFVLSLMAPLPGGLEVRCSMVDEPALDGQNGNVVAPPDAAAWAASCDPRLDRLDEAVCDDAQLGPAHCF